MCMKNININTMTFSMPGEQMSLIQPFDGIVAENTERGLVVHDFNVLVFVCAIFSDKQTDPKACVMRDNEYNVLVRLNHMHSNLGSNLGEYALKFDNKNVHEVCKPIFEQKKVFSVSELVLPQGAGQYAIKVFIKHKDDSKWFVQSIQTITIKSDS